MSPTRLSGGYGVGSNFTNLAPAGGGVAQGLGTGTNNFFRNMNFDWMRPGSNPMNLFYGGQLNPFAFRGWQRQQMQQPWQATAAPVQPAAVPPPPVYTGAGFPGRVPVQNYNTNVEGPMDYLQSGGPQVVNPVPLIPLRGTYATPLPPRVISPKLARRIRTRGAKNA